MFGGPIFCPVISKLVPFDEEFNVFFIGANCWLYTLGSKLTSFIIGNASVPVEFGLPIKLISTGPCPFGPPNGALLNPVALL